MLATIVRSPLALNVGGEEPERSGLLRIAKPEDIPPDRDRRLQPDADRAALVEVARSAAMRRTASSAVRTADSGASSKAMKRHG
jgi:hypothetical protein